MDRENIFLVLQNRVNFPDLDEVVRSDCDEKFSFFIEIHVTDTTLHVVESGQGLLPEEKETRTS